MEAKRDSTVDYKSEFRLITHFAEFFVADPTKSFFFNKAVTLDEGLER